MEKAAVSDRASQITHAYKYDYNHNMPILSANESRREENSEHSVWLLQKSPDFNSSPLFNKARLHASTGLDEDILKAEPSASGRCYMRIH